jgi:tetratricopeptide (TPR) repeat protein
VYERLGILRSLSNRHGEAAAEYREAVVLADELAAQFPDSSEHSARAAQIRSNQAGSLMAEGGLEEAEALLRHNVAFWEKLKASEPANANAASKLVVNLGNLGEVLERRGRKDETEQALRRAAELRLAMTKDFPNTPHYFNHLGSILTRLSRLARERGDLAEARRLAEQAVENTRAALALAPKNPEYVSGNSAAAAALAAARAETK